MCLIIYCLIKKIVTMKKIMKPLSEAQMRTTSGGGDKHPQGPYCLGDIEALAALRPDIGKKR